MAQRKKTSPVEEIFFIAASVPWYAGLIAAVVIFMLLHSFAIKPGTPPAATVDIHNPMAGAATTLIGTLAYLFQFILPTACLVGAAVSAWRQRHRKGLVSKATGSQAVAAIDGMTWREFEQLVGEGYRLQGYKVAELGGNGPDGGVDLVLTRGGEKFLVQCKQWRAYRVGVDVVRELYGVMAARGATGGFVVTSGQFTSDAVAFASGRNVQLVDGPQLSVLLRKATAARATLIPGSVEPMVPSMRPAARPSVATKASIEAPLCPRCESVMAQRTVKAGANAGKRFWGCSTYPACRGQRSVN